MEDNKIDISIVIPVYNEESILHKSIEELHSMMVGFGRNFEIIISENGSKDKTREILEELCKKFKEVRYLTSENPDYGAALKKGILAAKGDIVICDEIDLGIYNFYKSSIQILANDEADLVIGSKLLSGARDERPFLRHLATIIINLLLRLLLGFKGSDTHGLKSFRREKLLPIVNKCLVTKDLFASEFVIRAERENIRIKEIPLDVKEKRTPSINLFRRVPNVLKNLIKLFYVLRIKG
ncbi:MAG: glycosyltransferase family 2 protein [Deltaproteobacteria bacterium]|nr:glycosyltransferase family 2 protein [Deltaproteobacteria bacterium]